MVELPLTGRRIPLITDEWAKPELGSGCVKITPAHDQNDYDVWQRNESIGAINILNADGTLNTEAGVYQGLTIQKARQQVVADLAERQLVGEIEDREIELAHSDRSKTPIEPYLADQWFVKMDELAQSAMDAVTDERVKIFPPRYRKAYLDWLGEKRDWCISRNLWWGHRIPVWSARFRSRHLEGLECPTEIRERTAELRRKLQEALNQLAASVDAADDYHVSENVEGSSITCFIGVKSEAGREQLAGIAESIRDNSPFPTTDQRYAATELIADLVHELEEDPDVLDTWFSSALWPHSTLGWPEENEALNYFYPTSVLITSRDIITLWVARMVLSGLNNMGPRFADPKDAVPFHEVFIHPKVLDGYGETMSKSKGNGVDPLDVIEKFGPDALRFGLAYLTTETQDVRMPVQFECPHCKAAIEQTKKNRELPRVECKKCGREFSTQWARTEEDQSLARGPVISERFEQARNFCNKLWNAARFCFMNLEGYEAGVVAESDLAVEDRWLLSRLTTVTKQVTEQLETYHFAEAMHELYDFAWNDFCSFYVEIAKERLQKDATRVTAQRVLAHSLDILLRLLHPVIPFITEEIWQILNRLALQRGLAELTTGANSIMIASWPVADAGWKDAAIEAQFAKFQEVLGAIREIRSRQNLAPKKAIEFRIQADDATIALLEPMQAYFDSMANASVAEWGPGVEPPAINAPLHLQGIGIFVDLAGLIDKTAEVERLQKERTKTESLIQAKEKKLNNANFVDRAPADVVRKERDSLAQLREQHATIVQGLTTLASQE